MTKHLIGTSKNGKSVYANLLRAPLNAKVSRAPHLLTLVREIIEKQDLTGDRVVIEQDMKRTVGYSEHLPTQENDVIFYAKQPKTTSYTRFVKNRKATATTIMTVVLVLDETGEYEVADALIGTAYPVAPDATEATDESKAYWQNHAVVYNGQPIIANSLTKECPY